MMWLAGLTSLSEPGADDAGKYAAVQQQNLALGTSVRELEHQVRRLALMNQALWELIRNRLGLTDGDLEKIVREVDLRDGVEDGAVTNTPLRCPQCGRISNSRHWKCLYCGLEFEKPATA
jgi:hypothetical protein